MRITAGWLLIQNKKILLLKRSNYTKAFPWFWIIPWWRWEKNETAEEIAIREVKEESGLNFIPTKLFQSSIIEHSSWNYVKTNRFLGTFSWKIDVQKEEVDWYAWYNYNEAMNLDLAFDYKKVIEKLYNEKYL